MLKFLSLYIEGFCSIREAKINLNTPNTINLIQGLNGNGKSSIFSSLVWCIYGVNLKGKVEVNTWESLRPKNYPGTRVTLFFQKGSDTYEITRCQRYTKEVRDGIKGNNNVFVYCNGDLLEVKGKVNLRSVIEEIVGLSYNLFINSIMFGQGITRLIDETNSDKKKLFDEIFDLQFINNAKDLANSKKQKLYSSYLELESQMKSLTSELKASKTLYKESLEREEDFYTDKEESLKKLNSRSESLKEQLNKLDIKNTPSHNLNKYREKISELTKKLNKDKESVDISLEEFLDKILKLMDENKNQKAYTEIKETKSIFGRIDKNSRKLLKTRDKYQRLLEENSRNKSLSYRATSIQDQLNSLSSQISEVENKELVIHSKDHRKKITLLRKKLNAIKDKFQGIQTEYDNYKWLIDDPLGNKGLKNYLFDSSLNKLNEVLASYSKSLGFKIKFGIDLNSARKDFTTLIERGGQIIDYQELSGGEKQLCCLAMAFAMNEGLTLSKDINIAFLDEVFESLSIDNIELVTSLIKQVFRDKTLFLITHQRSIPISNSKMIKVEKVNGLTDIKQL